MSFEIRLFAKFVMIIAVKKPARHKTIRKEFSLANIPRGTANNDKKVISKIIGETICFLLPDADIIIE